MKVETRAQAHDHHAEEKMKTRKQKTNEQTEHQSPTKKAKQEKENDNGTQTNGTTTASSKEYQEFCKVIRENLSPDQIKEILQFNGQDPSGPDDSVISRCQDLLYYGALLECKVCGGNLQFVGNSYSCTGALSEWSTCTYKTRNPPRKQDPIKLPDSVSKSSVADFLKKYQDPSQRHQKEIPPADKPFTGMVICLSGRLSRTHQYWKKEIEKHGGKVSNTAIGVTCLVVSPMERERGGSSKVSEAVERGIPVVREAWLIDSIEKQELQPLEAYDCVSDRSSYGKGIPWDKQDPSEEALESLTAELKMYGKRGVYKDTMLQQQGGKILEKDGLLYNCAFSLCDLGRNINEIVITQLITVPEKKLHLYYKRGRVGDDTKADERLEEWDNVEDAIKEFARLFEELTGNEFLPWETEKKFQKKPQKFHVIDMDDGVEIRYGGLGVRQLGTAAVHCKLDPMIANFMKILCSQEIYRYALMEMGLDSPDLPVGMVTDLHLKRCEDALLQFIENVKSQEQGGPKAEALWSEFSSKWFTLMHTTRPFIFKDFQELADHAASPLETVRDITVASHLIGDMSGSTLDDPLSDRYKKLGCKITPLDKESDDFKMIINYLEKTYEPIKVGEISYDVSVENILAVDLSAGPSYEEIKKLPNKVLLWCGTRSSNLLRHLQKGFLPSICSLPAAGYMFGRAIVCSDAAAEAARYGYTAIDRPEGFLVLAVASLGDEIIEVTSPPEDTKSLEERKVGVKGIGRKKTDESEHFVWKDDIKVPCGKLVPASPEPKESILDFNEYAVYDPNQVKISFLVAVKYIEKDVVMDVAE
ncbi:protein ADP-ribosyltransferase PARP3 [Beta vulgaris subsp. vulgaris]|uniref:protein ADP-ribosyltransferase PARP3 n=1 Tax=Beta vulgaris subsp. vulgaris TaxID=3555 RepID=UPI0020373234|nr:protein ADP-ribosyltransferase PARP3 [Beta vulgaris subsp. vulgaris]